MVFSKFSTGRRSCEKLLGIRTVSNITFDDYGKYIRKKSNKKLIALAKATIYLKIEKKTNYLTLFSANSLAIAH